MSVVVPLFPKPLPREFAELRTLYRRWFRFVIQSRETPRRQRLKFLRKASPEYMTLHDRLLAECAALAEQATGSQLEFLDHLTSLVAPWSTLESLNYQPANILVDLIDQGTRVERTLHCPSRAPPWFRRLAVSIFVGAFALIVVPRLWLAAFPGSGSIVGYSREYGRSVTLFVERASDADRTAILAGVVLVAGVTALYSSRPY